jgi:hypothetical protein
VPTMVVLVNLKEGVSPEDYERWVSRSYAPAVRELPSVGDWRNYRVSGLLGSDADPPYRYVVTTEFGDLEQLGEDVGARRCGGCFRSCTSTPTSRSSRRKGSRKGATAMACAGERGVGDCTSSR